MPTSQEIHYTFGTRSAVINAATPTDVAYPKLQTSGTFDTDATGGIVLTIPTNLDFAPSETTGQTWDDLWDEKSLAILAEAPGMANIAVEDLSDPTGVFDAATASGVILGGRGTCIFGDTGSGATVTTASVALTGSAPAQAILWAETFMYMASSGASLATAGGYSNSKTGRFQRYLRSFGTASTFLQFDVSFNNGATYVNNVTPRALFNIPLVDQGTAMRLRVTRKVVGSPTGRIGLNAFALLY